MNKGEIITEVQGVETLKRYGLSNGKELETKYYIKNNCINTGAALNTYLEKLEQIYTYARLVINPKTNRPYSGTNRLIELGELRNAVEERKDGRINNGRQPTEDELILDQYIFNQLLELRELKPLPYRAWATKVSLFDVSKLSDKEFLAHLENTINLLHTNTLGYSKDDSIKIVKNFRNMLYKRNEDVIRRGLPRLEALGKIKTINSYHARTTKGEYKVISEGLFKQIKNEEEAILNKHDIDKRDYVLMKMQNKNRDNKYYEINTIVTNHLKTAHEILYYFEGKSIRLLDKVPYDDIGKYDMKTVYKKILLVLTIARENREGYQNTGDISKEWYTLNTFTLLKEMGIDIPEGLYNKYRMKLDKDRESYVVQNKQWEDDIEETFEVFGI